MWVPKMVVPAKRWLLHLVESDTCLRVRVRGGQRADLEEAEGAGGERSEVGGGHQAPRLFIRHLRPEICLSQNRNGSLGFPFPSKKSPAPFLDGLNIAS